MFSFNPFTGKLDYFEKSDLSSYATQDWVTLGYVPYAGANSSIVPNADVDIDLGAENKRLNKAFIRTLETGHTTGKTLNISGWDVDGAASKNFIVVTSGNTPTCVIDTSVTQTNWDAAYSWGNHAGLYLGISDKAADSDLWDGANFSDYLNQAVKTTSSPIFANITDSGITPGRIPYASTGGLFVNGPIYTDGTKVLLGVTSVASNYKFFVSQSDLAIGMTVDTPTSSATGRALLINATGESFSRSVFYTNGFYGVGPGSSTRDVFFGRGSTNTFLIGINYNGSGAGNLMFNDSGKVYFGTGKDVFTQYTGTYWDFDIAQATTAIRFNQAQFDTDFIVYGDTGAMITADAGTLKTTFNKINISNIPTSSAGLSSGDVWCDTTGGLNILKIV